MYEIFFVWIAIGAVAFIIGATAARVSTQRLKRTVAPLARVATHVAAQAPSSNLRAAA